VHSHAAARSFVSARAVNMQEINRQYNLPQIYFAPAARRSSVCDGGRKIAHARVDDDGVDEGRCARLLDARGGGHFVGKEGDLEIEGSSARFARLPSFTNRPF
jgi:hypothetical protein